MVLVCAAPPSADAGPLLGFTSETSGTSYHGDSCYRDLPHTLALTYMETPCSVNSLSSSPRVLQNCSPQWLWHSTGTSLSADDLLLTLI